MPPSITPSEPPGSCWMAYGASGCPGGDGGIESFEWIRDTWGEENGYGGEAGCANRKIALNYWCGVNDVSTFFVALARSATSLETAARRTHTTGSYVLALTWQPQISLEACPFGSSPNPLLIARMNELADHLSPTATPTASPSQTRRPTSSPSSTIRPSTNRPSTIRPTSSTTSSALGKPSDANTIAPVSLFELGLGPSSASALTSHWLLGRAVSLFAAWYLM